MVLTAWQYQRAATRDCKDIRRLFHLFVPHVTSQLQHVDKLDIVYRICTWQTAWRRTFDAG